jgi:ATP-dependent DNA ligase
MTTKKKAAPKASATALPNGSPKGSRKGSPTARFIQSMECLPVSKLPQGPEWSYEIKFDGFRLEAVKNNSETTLFSRRGTILNRNSTTSPLP